MLFRSENQRSDVFRAERLSSSQAVKWLMSEYISQQFAQQGGADHMFDIFSDLVTQAQSYRIFLAPDVVMNAQEVQMLVRQHLES